jgi:hypothetical protein
MAKRSTGLGDPSSAPPGETQGKRNDWKAAAGRRGGGRAAQRLAKQIVSQIVNEPIEAGGTMSDVMMLCESVMVGVMLGCFQLGSDAKVVDLIVGRVCISTEAGALLQLGPA